MAPSPSKLTSEVIIKLTDQMADVTQNFINGDMSDDTFALKTRQYLGYIQTFAEMMRCQQFRGGVLGRIVQRG